MPDPFSLASLAIQLGEVIWKLYEYGKQVKEWKGEIRALCEELFALQGVIEHLKQRHESVLKSTIGDSSAEMMRSADFSQMLQTTRDILDELLTRLAIPIGRVHRAARALAWPLTKSDVQAHVNKLARVKAWFVMVMMSDSLDLSRSIHEEVVDLGEFLRSENNAQRLERDEQEKKKLIDWLAPVNPRGTHTKSYAKWQTGTSQWFTKGFFEQWFAAHSQNILWLQGKSGAGKTTLFSSIVELALQRTRDDPRHAVLYFYCSYDNAASQDPVNILAAFVTQLSEKCPSMLNAYQARYLTPNRADVPELEDQLITAAGSLDGVYVFFDALNESSLAGHVVKSLLRIVQSASNVQLLVTTTPDTYLQEILYSKRMIQVDMRPHWIEGDIRVFVAACIEQSPTLRSLSDSIKMLIEQTIIGKADGMCVSPIIQCLTQD
jgi:hypothetical protein